MASRPIDEQIIKMTLDEAEFKRRAESTIGIFGRLNNLFGQSSKNAPMFDKSTASLEDLNYAANNTTMDKLLNAVDSVTNRFSVMGELANRILTNIAMKAINVGTTLVKSLSVDQIMAGFSEYELKMGSIQTILSNTEHAGTTLDQVSASLDELNEYADKTIYNFADMTSNIGRFTTAGVGLDDSVTAIKGLSNLAAVSGSNTGQAANAMYQLSQELANGKVTLQGWNSVVNAGMGGKKFQDALIESGKNMGSVKDETKSFRDSLQDGWVTSEVLLDTLSKFAEDESMLEAATKVRTFTQMMDTLKEAAGSGWAKTWELLIGDFEIASELWTKANDAISSVIESSSDARNKLVEGFINLGGRDSIVAVISNLFQAGVQISSIAKDAFTNIFPPVTAQQLLNLVNGLKEFTASLQLSEAMAGKVSTIFKGVFSIFSSLWEIIKRLGSSIVEMLPWDFITTGANTFLGALTALAEKLIEFNTLLKAGNSIGDSLNAVGLGIGGIVDGVLGFLGGAVSVFFGMVDGLGGLIEPLTNMLSTVWTHLTEFLGSFTTQDFMNMGVIGIITLVMKKLDQLMDFKNPFSNFLSTMEEFFNGMGDKLSIFDKLGDALSSFTSAVKVASLVAIAVAVGILAVSLKLLEGISPENIAKGLGALGAILGGLTGALWAISKMNTGVMQSVGAGGMLLSMATTMIVIAGALKMVSGIDAESTMRSVNAILYLMTGLTASLAVMAAFGPTIGKSIGIAITLGSLSTSLLLIAQSVKMLGALDPASLQRGLLSMTGILGALALFMALTQGVSVKIWDGKGLLEISQSVSMIGDAVIRMGVMDAASLVKGLAAMGLIMAGLASVSLLTSKINPTAMGPLQFIAIAAAINMIVGPITELGNLPVATLVKGLSTITLALIAMSGAMTLATGGAGGAGAILVMAVALNILIPVLTSLGSLPIPVIVTALVSLAAVLGIIGLAATLLTPTIPSIFALGLAVAAMGVGVGLAAAGLAALAAGFLALSTVNIIGILSQFANAGVWLMIVDAIRTILPAIAQTGVDLIVIFLEGIITTTPLLVQGMMTIIMSLITAIRNNLSGFISAAVDIIVILAEGLAQGLPRLLEAAVKLIIDLINGLANAIREYGPQLVDAVFNLMGAIFEVVVDAMIKLVDVLFGWIPGVEGALETLGVSAKETLRDVFDTGSIGTEGGQEFADAIAGVSADDAGTAIADSAIVGMLESDIEGTGTTKGEDFVRGVSSQELNANTAGKSVSQKGRSGAASVSWFSTGSDAVSGFVSGIWGNMDSVYTAGVSMAEKAMTAVKDKLDSHSPSREMIPEGANFVMGMVKGISNNTKYAASAAGNMASKAMDTAKSYVDTFMEVLAQDMETNPVVKPVLDLSNIDQNSLQFTPTSLGTSGVSLMKDMMNYINPKREVVQEERTVDTKDDSKPIVINFNNPIVESKEAVQELTREAMLEADRLLGRFISQSKGGRSIA